MSNDGTTNESKSSEARDSGGQQHHFNFRQKFESVTKIITVEPLLALYQMAILLSKPALDNLEFEKSCRVNLKYDNTVCQAVLEGRHENYSGQNDDIQIVISNMHSWQQPLQSFTPLVLAMFLGSFSDRYKWRKPFFLLPIVGEIVGNVGCILCVIYMTAWPLQVQGVLQKVVPSLFGGQTMIGMATTAYIADVSSVKMRTLRLGVVQIVISVTLPLTHSFSGVLFSEIGYLGILIASAVLLLVALLYGMFCIKEYNQHKEKNVARILRDVFNPKSLTETLELFFKKKAGVSRSYLTLIFVMIFTYRVAFDGESNVLYLYTQNVFQWTPVEYSYFLTVTGLVLLFGNVVSLPLFTKVFKMSDLTIILVALITKILTNITFGLARSPSVFYIGAFISVVTRMFRVAKKSLTTKVVDKDDIGKTQSVLGIFEAIAPAVSVPVYNFIYIKTLVIYPSAFFFFSIIIYGFCCLMPMWMFCKEKKKLEMTEAPTTTNEHFIQTLHI